MIHQLNNSENKMIKFITMLFKSPVKVRHVTHHNVLLDDVIVYTSHCYHDCMNWAHDNFKPSYNEVVKNVHILSGSQKIRYGGNW
jgi:hypothetical protein